MKISPQEQEIGYLARGMNALGYKERFLILKVIRNETCTTEELAKQVKMTKQMLSRHLKAMREAGIVDFEWHGGCRYYYINDEQIDQIFKDVRAVIGISA